MPLVGPNALLSPLAPMTLPAPLKTIAHFAALFFYQSTALGALFAGRTKRSTLFHFHVEAFGSENIFLMRARLGWPQQLTIFFLGPRQCLCRDVRSIDRSEEHTSELQSH